MISKLTNKIESQSTISYLDIGARWGISWPWSQIQSDKLEVFLVEPDLEEAEILKKQGYSNVLPYALWGKETELTLKINNLPATSSVFEPNLKFLKQFPDSQRFEAREKINIKTKTIDGLASEGELNSIDFVKIDVQGGEHEILQGGENFLKNNIVGLEVEVEFAEMYQNQPLFSDIDIFVRGKLGLELWDIRKVYWKYNQKKYKAPLKGRLIFGDALYLRPATSLDSWLSPMDNKDATLKMKALITVSIAYGYLDYALTLLSADYIDKYLSLDSKESYILQIHKISNGFYPFKNGNRWLYRGLNVLMKIFEPSYKGFGTADSNLGSKKRLFFWN